MGLRHKHPVLTTLSGSGSRIRVRELMIYVRQSFLMTHIHPFFLEPLLVTEHSQESIDSKGLLFGL